MVIKKNVQKTLKLKIFVFYVIGFSLLIFSFLLSYIFMVNVIEGSRVFLEWEIFFLNGSSVVFSLIFDWLSISFLILVFIISSIVIFYSFYYMEGDKEYLRFSIVLLLFVLSIMFLILSPNMISLLLG